MGEAKRKAKTKQESRKFILKKMAQDIYSILRGRFPEHEYALMREVRDKAGFDASRSADYIAVNLYPSRGLAMHGIELKSFRSDWLNELKNPKKAENIFQYCDYFWLLTTDDKVAKIEEIPKSWGWLCIKGDRVFTKKPAPQLKPKPISRSFMCAILKRASDKSGFIHRDSISDKIETARNDGRSENERELTRLKNELNEIKNNVLEFEKASGVYLNRLASEHFWGDPKEMGKAFKLVHDSGGITSIKEQLLGLEDTAKIVLERISDGLKKINQNG
jgi:hypothetical protein